MADAQTPPEWLGPPKPVKHPQHCHGGRDGECNWRHCPQIRDNEPETTGRHCPLDNWDDDDDR